MKKLKKLQINPEKMMNNDELIMLRGGYGWWYCFSEGYIPNCYGYLGPVWWPYSGDTSEIIIACQASYGTTGCVAPA